MKYIDLQQSRDARDIEIIIKKFKAGTLQDGDPVSVKGAIHHIKNMGEFAFVNVRSPRRVFQCVWEAGKSSFDIHDIQPEDWVLLDGRIVADARSPLGFDIRMETITKVGGAVGSLPLEISNDRKIKNLQLDTMLNNRVVALRNPRIRAIMRVADGVMYGFRSFLREEGFVEFVPPKLVMGGAEGGADMFMVKYFDQRAYLNQSPQQYKQAMVGVFEKVFTVGPVFRGENSNTPRHAAEFWMIEPEIAFADLADEMDLSEAMVKSVIAYVLETCPDEMAFFNQFFDKTLLERLNALINSDFARVSYTEAVEILSKHNDSFQYKVEWGTDLQTEHERFLTEQIYKKPVFVTDYPKAIKSFYMRVNGDGKTVAAADMLVPGVGELCGGSQREERLDVLTARMDELGLSRADYEWYLELRRFGTVEHAGFGLGFERLIMYLTGIPNIRDVLPFPRTAGGF